MILLARLGLMGDRGRGEESVCALDSKGVFGSLGLSALEIEAVDQF